MKGPNQDRRIRILQQGVRRASIQENRNASSKAYSKRIGPSLHARIMDGSGSVMTMNMRDSAVIVVSLALVGQGFARGPEVMVGKSLPAFSVKDVNGKTWNNATLKGKTVVLDFWATWCGPCKAASATMQKLATKYASKGLVVLALNGYDAAPKVKQYVTEHKYSFPFLVDAKPFQDKLSIATVPAIFVVGKSGKIETVVSVWNDSSPASFERAVVSGLK